MENYGYHALVHHEGLYQDSYQPDNKSLNVSAQPLTLPLILHSPGFVGGNENVTIGFGL